MFGGAGVSHVFEAEEALITPRLGVDLAWAPGPQVSLTARQGDRSESGAFGLGSAGTWRLFLETELRTAPEAPLAGVWPFDGYAVDLGLTPSVACEGSDEGAPDCGVGLRGDLGAASADKRTRWSLEIEATGSRLSREISAEITWERRLDPLNGAVRFGFGVDAEGAPAARLGGILRF